MTVDALQPKAGSLHRRFERVAKCLLLAIEFFSASYAASAAARNAHAAITRKHAASAASMTLFFSLLAYSAIIKCPAGAVASIAAVGWLASPAQNTKQSRLLM